MTGQGGQCGRVHDHSFQTSRSIVAMIGHAIGIMALVKIAKMFWSPAELPCNGFCIGIEQQLMGIEQMALIRPVGAMDPVAVHGTRSKLRRKSMPDVAFASREVRPCNFVLSIA